MESKFFKSAIFRGRDANAIKLGTVLSLGRWWVRTEGCFVFYRGQSGAIDYNSIQAVYGLAASEFSLAGQNLPPSTTWSFVRRQCSGCGLESADSAAVIITIDANGDWLGNIPNAPINTAVEPIAGAKFRLRWRYVKTGQTIAASGFKIYIDSGSGFDFENPAAIVAYQGQVEFSWGSDAMTHGQTYNFIVRSYAAAGGESSNVEYASAVADSQGPAAAQAEDLEITWEPI